MEDWEIDELIAPCPLFDPETDAIFNHLLDDDHNPPPATMTILEEDMHVWLDESPTDIRVRPASKFALDSLSSKAYDKKTMSSSDMCTICLDEFKMGERVVTLPCGHEFDDSCILEWFATNHVCPLCRFEMP